MTKNFNSNNLSSNNKNNKKKNIKNDSINNADKIMEELYTELNSEEMGMEQFQKVLEQIADHSLPESEKLEIVQKLNQEHAKEDNCLEDVIKSNQTNKTKNLQRKQSTKLNNLINDKLDNNEIQSTKESHLQKLENYCDQFVNNNCTSTSLTNSLLNNCNHQLNRLNNDQIMSNEMYLKNSSFNKSSFESSQKLINKESCDNLKCEHKKNRLLFNVSNTNENYENYEFKDYSRQAQIVEYTSALKYADLKENNDLDEHKLEPLIKNKDLKSTTANHYDQSNQLKYNLVNTQYAEKILDELKDTNRNYSSDCLNRYQTNLIDNQSHTKLSSSTSDGYISSMNTYFDNDNKSSNFQLNSNYLKKGTSSIQTNGKSENNHLKKKKKPEKKLTQHCQGYVGYLDVNFLTNYITGNKTDMRNQINSTNNTKEMNIKKKDKFNNLNNKQQNKKNGQSIMVKETDNDLNQLNNQSNDKNNNLTIATNSSTLDNTATTMNSTTMNSTTINSTTINSTTNSTNIIPNSSINQLNDNSRKNSIDKITNENNQNMNNQTKQNSKLDKKIENKKFTSNQSRKLSAASNLELNNNNQKLINQRTKDDKLNNSDNAKTANGGIDPMYIVSDSEVPDQEGDFKIVKYKNLRRKKQKKNDDIKLTNQQNKELIKQKKFNNQNKQNPATARGYESESDYCAVEGRKRESNLKRDILIDDKKQQNKQQQNYNNKNSISDSGSSINSQQTNDDNNQQNELLINTKLATKLPQQQQQTNFIATFTNQPQFTNPNIPYSKISTNPNKISYAAITKMNYTNNTTALQIATTNNNSNTINLINNDNNLTNQETNKKETINKKINNKNDNKSIKSIFNTNEQNNKKTDDKKSNDKEPKKVIHLDNSNSDNNEPKEINYNNLSDDNSRTITATSIDYQFTSDSSKTSNSFNTTPPVIMLDEKNSNQDTKFTFGFFDENDKLSASNLEDESNDDFKTINIDSVNFISNNKEPSNNSINNCSFSYQSNTSLNEVNNVSCSNKNLDSSTVDNNSNSTLSSPSSINTNNESTTNLSTSSNTTSTNNNNNTQFCQGTYIMNCDNNEDSSSLRDNITKHVNTNEFNKSSGTLANEITSFNLTKFIKEKIPSPIIPEVQNHNQFNLNQQRYHQPEPKKSVAYIKTVNYIRKAWEEAISNPNTVYM